MRTWSDEKCKEDLSYSGLLTSISLNFLQYFILNKFSLYIAQKIFKEIINQRTVACFEKKIMPDATLPKKKYHGRMMEVVQYCYLLDNF